MKKLIVSFALLLVLSLPIPALADWIQSPYKHSDLSASWNTDSVTYYSDGSFSVLLRITPYAYAYNRFPFITGDVTYEFNCKRKTYRAISSTQVNLDGKTNSESHNSKEDPVQRNTNADWIMNRFCK